MKWLLWVVKLIFKLQGDFIYYIYILFLLIIHWYYYNYYYRDALVHEIDIEHKRYFKLNSLRNPFKDIEMYAIPVAMSSVGWALATVVDILDMHSSVLSTINSMYMFLAFGVLLLALKNPFKNAGN